MSGNTPIVNPSNQQFPANCQTKSVDYIAQLASASLDTFDLTNLEMTGQIDNIQSMFVDNSANSASVSATFSLSNQKVVIPPYSQGWIPIIAPKPAKVAFASTGGVNVPFFFVNVPMPAEVWSTLQSTGSGGGIVLASGGTVLGSITELSVSGGGVVVTSSGSVGSLVISGGGSGSGGGGFIVASGGTSVGSASTLDIDGGLTITVSGGIAHVGNAVIVESAGTSVGVASGFNFQSSTVAVSGGIATVTPSGGGSGGGNLIEQNHTLVLSSGTFDQTLPTLIGGMQLTVPANASATTLLVAGLLEFSGPGSIFLTLYLDGTSYLVIGPAGWPGYGTSFSGSFAGLAVAIPGDNATHTLAVYGEDLQNTGTRNLNTQALSYLRFKP